MEGDSTFNNVWCPKSCKLLHGLSRSTLTQSGDHYRNINSLVQSGDQVVENAPRLRSNRE